MGQARDKRGVHSHPRGAFGRRIKALRLACGRDGREVSQRQLAEIIGVGESTIRKWEEGLCEPRQRLVLERIGQVERQARIAR